MLDHAVKYQNRLNELFLKISDDLDFQYAYGKSYRDVWSPATSTWSRRELVSTHRGQVIGYISYSIDRDSNHAYGLQVINFTGNPSIIFAKDLTRFLKDIFDKYDFQKLNFSCMTDNPIIDSYKRLCTEFGGSIVGVKHRECKLLDGQLRDLMLFEILRENYLKVKNERKI